ncbi:MAG: ABC transporter ATP-binding protein [Deltaproteobacteria bacterium]|nr:ABC transporter ATP-binding protein [Deltaproteobacteria bacterium]
MPGFDNIKGSSPDQKDLVPPLMEADQVSKRYGEITALSETSFKIREGQIVGLVGSDGAGKTTLLRMAATMMPPTTGAIRIAELDVVREKAKVKGLIGYMPQRFGLYQDLTVAENLDFFMDVFGIWGDERKKRRERYLGFSNLLPYVDRKAGDLSGGMKQKLGLACVLVHHPRMLILDEPTNGVDPVSRKEFWDIIAEMKGEGMTILVSTAYLDEGEKCDRLILMHASHVLAEAPPSQLKKGFPDLEEAMVQRILAVDRSLSEKAVGV